jgi:SRSO17 transposase
VGYWWFVRCVRPAAGPLEDYAACFDELFSRLAQRRGFREYLTGLLAPRDRNKTLTGLAGSEPVEGAQHAAVQRLQYFLSQSTSDADEVNRRRLELLVNDPATAPHAGGVIAIDDSGDRKDGTRTAHVGRQWLGRYGKTDNGIVTVTTVWADERVYYPLHAEPYTPAAHFPKKQASTGWFHGCSGYVPTVLGPVAGASSLGSGLAANARVS